MATHKTPELAGLTPELALIRNERRSLLIFGCAFILLGIAIAQSPEIFFAPAAFLMSLGLIASGLLKAFQFFLGKNKRGYSFKSAALILGQVLIDIGVGVIFLINQSISFKVVAFFLGLLFMTDGAIQLVVAWRSRGVKARLIFFINAIFTFSLGALTILLIPQLKIGGVALLVAIRLISFGAVLISMSIRSRNNALPVIYREVEPDVLHREIGELYACYFGSGFHLGVYIGNNEVVHYRDDSIVHRTSWEEFLRGREPQHWRYPDIKVAPVDVVVKTAKAQAGKKMKYNLITNNCEHFAIYCKTGGAQRDSRYAQTSSAITNLKQRPFIAVFVEAYTRAGEWLAFHFGGTFGHKVSYRIRRFNSMVTAWMLSTKQPKPAKVKS
ncbi:MAG: lecithin retinol acyltransferase family protein [Candidatus Saccharibacteria bacterium]